MTNLPRRLSLRHLRLAVVLEEEKSVVRAARRLFVSPAAISKTKAEIEAQLGAEVFKRFENELHPTEVGRQVLLTARRVLAEMHNLEEELVMLNGGLRGTLSIGIRSVAAQPFIARATTLFKERQPQLNIRLVDMGFDDLLASLMKGAVSLVVARTQSDETIEGVESRIIMADPTVVVSSPRHALADRDGVGWAELLAQRWCLIPKGYAGRISREYLADQLRRVGVDTGVLLSTANVVEANSLTMQIALLQEGDYLTLLPRILASQLVQLRLARPVRVPPLGLVDPVCMMWRADTALPPVARRFRDFALELLAAKPIVPRRRIDAWDMPPAGGPA